MDKVVLSVQVFFVRKYPIALVDVDISQLEWLDRNVDQAQGVECLPILTPANVSDRNDPKIVHLDGLNLSRAWCMRSIAESLPAGDPVRAVLLASATRHAEATLPHIASGSYAGEHWLATFAVYMLTE